MTLLVPITVSLTCVLFIVNVYLTLRSRRERMLANQKIQDLLDDLMHVSDTQKDIIYRNMHDHVNPMLRHVVRNIELHRSELKKQTLKPEVFEQDIDVLLMALNDIRSCTHGQVPESLKTQGYIASLEEILKKRAGSSGIEIQFINNTSFKREIPIDDLRQLDLFRISSEILENIIRHSHSSRIEVVLSQAENQLSIAFTHNGKGLTNKEAEYYMNRNEGTGLKSCHTRAKLLNAHINYTQSPGLYLTELTVPYQWKNL